MIIDVHSHIFSPAIRENRSAFFSGEPAFQLLYNSPKSQIVGAAKTVEMMDEEGVGKSIVFGFPWRNPDVFKRENDYVLEAVNRYPDRLIGFCCFDAMHPEAGREAERCLSAGLAGVGELAFYQEGIDAAARDALEPVMAVCREKNCPVLIHTNEPIGHVYPGKSPNTLPQIYEMVKQYPENTIILAHWGAGIFFYRLLRREVKETLKNVYYDTAASPFLYDPSLYALAMEMAGAEKILLGTDYPLLRPGRYFKEMEKAGLAGEEAEKIKGKNAAALLNIG